jgi:hypothetical protein
MNVEEPPLNLWNFTNLLLQKFPAEEFSATMKLHENMRTRGEKTGLIVFGMDYSYLAIEKSDNNKRAIVYCIAKDASIGKPEKKTTITIIDKQTWVYFRVKVQKEGLCHFSYSLDNINFTTIEEPFNAKEGKWVGAKVGLFASGETPKRIKKFGVTKGTIMVDWFRIEK